MSKSVVVMAKTEEGMMDLYDLQTHVREKGMWAGILKRATIPNFEGLYLRKVPDAGAPGAEPPGAEPPAAEPPDAGAPGAEPPDAGAPGAEPPGAEPPGAEPPGAEPPGAEPPRRDLVADLVAKAIPRDHTPAVLKCWDEHIVNATDHHVGCRKNPRARQVTQIEIGFDGQTFFVENDGPGIPVVEHEKASAMLQKEKGGNRKVYNPEVAFCWLLGGTNLEREADSIKGGINGIGAKLGNLHSREFRIQTFDDRRGLFYLQVCHDRLRTIDPPIVMKKGAPVPADLPGGVRPKYEPHTRVAYEIDYAQLGYPGGLTPQDRSDLDAWLWLRCCQAAAYVGPKCRVIYNGGVCPTDNAGKLAQVMVASLADPYAVVMSTALRAKEEPYKSHPWDFAVVVSPALKKFAHTSILSSVVTAKGPHLTYLKRVINDEAQKKIRTGTKDRKKIVRATETCKHVYIVVAGPLPGADWGGQRKDELQVAEVKLRGYTIPAKFLGEVAKLIAALLVAADTPRDRRPARVGHGKYKPARRTGARNPKATLLAAEGDSAIALLENLLTLGKKNPGGPSYENYGTFSLGGVPMNAMKQVSEHETAAGKTVIVRSETLKKNEGLAALVDVLGLSYQRSYETSAELRTLRYPGGLVGCTDQDLDGTGKILPLLLVFIYTFWPGLIRQHYVGRWLTPVIRAVPRRKGPAGGSAGGAAGGAAGGSVLEPVEFFYEQEYDDWAAADPALAAQYNISYYKGLAGWSSGADVLRLGRVFSENVHWFTEDDAAKHQFRVFYGGDPTAKLRKAMLRTPVKFLTAEQARRLRAARRMPCTVLLHQDAKAYKIEALRRQIPDAIDGLKPAQRKILAGAIRLAAAPGGNKARKVFQLGGSVAEHEFYHHGDASLNGTIVYLAQCYPGARGLPLLEGIGQFGTRHRAGADAGSPRYISVRLMKGLAGAMFPAADRYLLQYVFEEGERAEPVRYVPVVPRAILESGRFPSEGWDYKAWGRSFGEVLKVARTMVEGRAPTLVELADRFTRELYADAEPSPEAWLAVAGAEKEWPLPVCTREFGGEIRPYRKTDHHFGDYLYDEGSNTIYVTELPMRVATRSFVDGLTAPVVRTKPNPLHAYIDPAGVEEYSSGEKVDVAVPLKPGAWGRIQENFGDADIDPVEDMFKLRVSLASRLNFMRIDGAIVELKDSYLAVILHWFPVRRDLYAARLARQAVLLELRIAQEDEVLRYIGASAALEIARMPDEARMAERLEAQAPPFTRFDNAILHTPQFESAHDPGRLRERILRGDGAGYEYIYNLRERDLVEAAAARRRERRNRLAEELAQVRRDLDPDGQAFPGARVWLSELATLEKAVAEGIKANWTFKKE